MPKTTRRLGWIPDHPDIRDLMLEVKRPAKLPPSVDLRPGFPPAYDQGDIGSCTANAIAANLEFDQIKQKLKLTATPSRLFIYYNERAMEGTVASDAGAMIRDGIKSVNQLGAPPETDWPYDPAMLVNKPTDKAYADALLLKSLKYARVQVSLTQVKAVLAKGTPVVFGFTVYGSFMGSEVAASGNVPMPGKGEAVEGGHAVCMAGYNDASWTDAATGKLMQPGIIVRNSWGAGWGVNGYCVMPYGFVNPLLANDFWTIQTVE